MVGSALVRTLQKFEDCQVVTAERDELNITNDGEVCDFIKTKNVQQVYLAAAKVGGIKANNDYPASFIQENLQIQNGVIHGAYRAGVDRLLFLGSSCIYPRNSTQPMAEEVLLTGILEPTNEPYALAKIAGIKMCESYNRQYGTDFRAVMPTNLYGPGDNFHAEHSHVVPALMARIHDAKLSQKDEVVIWGSGNAMREFLHVDDMASACHFVMNLAKEQLDGQIDERRLHLNVGTGKDVTIRELAETLCGVIGYQGQLTFDTTKPDGTPRKLLQTDRLARLGWEYAIELQQGLLQTYEWFQSSQGKIRR